MKKIRAKFHCFQVIPADETHNYPSCARLHAVYSDKNGNQCEENKSFSDSTPSGNVDIMISANAPAHKFFREGEEYYLDFIRAPIDKE